MRTGWILLMGVFLAALPGCTTPDETAGRKAAVTVPAGEKDRVYLTVDFEPGRTLRYRFVSRRNITLDWDPDSTATKNRVQEHAEHLEMVVAYTPIEVDPYGLSTIKATVESVRAVRSGGPTGRASGIDAVESAQGRSYTIKVDPRGRIGGTDRLKALIQEMGEKAFREDTSGGRTKEPDMVGDFVTSQWFLWDAPATIPLPAEGLAIGQTWPSELPVPTPMVMRKARDVTYRYNGVRAGPRGAAAVIESTYTLAQSAPTDWPVPYSGRFRMSGTFGFLGPYEVLGLEGSGEELYNLEAGRLEQRQQKYTMQVKASLPPMGIRASPHITIEQILTTELLEGEIRNPNIETRNKHE